jgi:hypothetical protein
LSILAAGHFSAIRPKSRESLDLPPGERRLRPLSYGQSIRSASRSARPVDPHGQSIRSASRSARPVDPLGQPGRGQLDQPAALDLAVLPARAGEPVDGALAGVGDQHLADLVRGAEGEVPPGLVLGGDDLDHEGGGRIPDPVGELATSPADRTFVDRARPAPGGADRARRQQR